MSLSERQLNALRSEYSQCVVEYMTHRQALSYLRQIMYNEVSHLTEDELCEKIVKVFDQGKCDQMLSEVTDTVR
jgi:hypothetical protein